MCVCVIAKPYSFLPFHTMLSSFEIGPMLSCLSSAQGGLASGRAMVSLSSKRVPFCRSWSMSHMLRRTCCHHQVKLRQWLQKRKQERSKRRRTLLGHWNHFTCQTEYLGQGMLFELYRFGVRTGVLLKAGHTTQIDKNNYYTKCFYF